MRFHHIHPNKRSELNSKMFTLFLTKSISHTILLLVIRRNCGKRLNILKYMHITKGVECVLMPYALVKIRKFWRNFVYAYHVSLFWILIIIITVKSMHCVRCIQYKIPGEMEPTQYFILKSIRNVCKTRSLICVYVVTIMWIYPLTEGMRRMGGERERERGAKWNLRFI